MITTEQKTGLIDSYMQRPRGLDDVPILKAIKTDLIKLATKGTSKASEQDNKLYNEAMGVYRQFLKSRNSHLDMKGKKAIQYSHAMRGIISYIRGFQQQNGKESGDQYVLAGLRFMFANWDRLNTWHQNRLALPDIYDKIEEIIPMIKNGHDKRTQTTSTIEQRQAELEQKRQARADQGH
ncbi:MAG: hypothetical protein HC819_14940 [Cyclobacteriaceae bacterium]|nr:hypothetical protein [Cyclobacteriaceae bacterium]